MGTLQRNVYQMVNQVFVDIMQEMAGDHSKPPPFAWRPKKVSRYRAQRIERIAEYRDNIQSEAQQLRNKMTNWQATQWYKAGAKAKDLEKYLAMERTAR